MRLKNLNIKGFKSFADETSLNFHDDVIGVVGPNGSGKSNVVDAIRWVLGEQKSRELRLEKMSDIIFNGTKNRKASNTAQVTLTFENDKGVLPSEYQTISIARILYRSGESEYRLNGVTCRLKDITTLLMDTGIGSNSYAIIALGMVDDILADKENARRKMFEQAAGISKYKKRKRETLNKLKGTTSDLDRVEDLLFEIEGNLKSLEKQAKRAKKYLDIKAQYRALGIQYAKVSIHSLKEEYKELGSALRKEQDKYSLHDVELNKKEALLEAQKKEHLEEEATLSSSQKKLNEIVTNLRNKESDKSLLLQKSQFNKDNIEKLKRDIANGEEELKKLILGLESIQHRIKEETNSAKSFSKDVASLKEKYEAIKSDYNKVKSASDQRSLQRDNLNNEIFNLEKELALTKNNVQNIKESLQRTKDELALKKTAFKEIKQALQDLDKDVKSKSKSIENLQVSEDKRKDSLAKYDEERNRLNDKLAQLNRLIDSYQNEYDLLQSMIASYEGFPESIKFLSNNWNKDVPILSDLLDVDDSVKAIVQQYLEPYLNYFVVDDLSAARVAIDLLKKSQKGKANFFILDQLEDITIVEANLPDIVHATTKVKVDDKYTKLLNYILKDVFVYHGSLDDFDPIIYPSDYTYLSSTGTFLKGKNYLSGGSIGLFEGKKIGRKKNLEKLSKKLEKAEKDKERVQQKYEDLILKIQELKSVNKENEIKALQQERANLLQQSASYTTRMDVYKQLKKETQLKEEQADTQISALQNKMKSIENSLKDKHKDLKKINESASGEADLDHLNDILNAASQKYNQATIANIQQKNLLDNLEKDLDFKNTQKRNLDNKIAQDRIRLRDTQTNIHEIAQEINTIDGVLKSGYDEKKTFESQLSAAEQNYYGARQQITAIENEIKQIARVQNQIQLKVQEIRDKYTDTKFKISTVGERLKIEFDVNINDIINDEIEDGIDNDALYEKVERLKSRLNNYGEVNPMAVEAYDEMKERFDNITQQRADILEAKASLIKTIKEIETSATEMFLRAFDEVRVNFIEVFRSLFSEEDNCNLILVDEDNPLESPIEIIAKPKGKKPKSLSQLSGGEKTLTATALLFALYLLKPAPFCIFDEVDAPLDDANIQKFNKIIKKFSKDSQFIIVTHNKSTMSAVDILYGVHMAEMGVSGVTAVDFRALEDNQI